MVNLVFEFSTDSKSSIKKAIKQLEQTDFEKFADELCNKLCEIGRRAAMTTYAAQETLMKGETPNNVNVVVEPLSRNRYQVRAYGSTVCFLEFGTGAYASVASATFPDKKLPITIAPGSWSKNHAQTYQRWVKSHNGDDTYYPYNRRPKRGMWEAYKAIIDAIEKTAEDCLNDKH